MGKETTRTHLNVITNVQNRLKQFFPSKKASNRILLLLSVFGLWIFSNVCAAQDNSLTERSPFLPPGYSNKPKNENITVRPPPPPPPPIPPSVELRGIIEFDGKVQFSLFDKKTQKGNWYFLNESKDGYVVKNYDKINNSITLNYNGSEFNIDLKEPSVEAPVAPMSISPQTPQPQQGMTATMSTTSVPAETTTATVTTDAAATNTTARPSGSRRDRNISGIREAVSNLNQ